MNLNDSIKLERYKLITDRQKYFTELARDAFGSYLKVFVGLAAGLITLVSAKSQLKLDHDILIDLIQCIKYLITFMGAAITGQIIFCLFRWYGYHGEERQFYSSRANARKKNLYWLFEAFYVLMIIISLAVLWIVIPNVSPMINQNRGTTCQTSSTKPDSVLNVKNAETAAPRGK
jgi:hypothetical protein